MACAWDMAGSASVRVCTHVVKVGARGRFAREVGAIEVLVLEAVPLLAYILGAMRSRCSVRTAATAVTSCNRPLLRHHGCASDLLAADRFGHTNIAEPDGSTVCPRHHGAQFVGCIHGWRVQSTPAVGFCIALDLHVVICGAATRSQLARGCLVWQTLHRVWTYF